MKAIENGNEVRSTAALWQKAFRERAIVIGRLGGREVLWHENLAIWGSFGKTHSKGGITRDWNAFGQVPFAFRRNMVVEINQPPSGINRNIQAVFARDADGHLWLLHQGRMSVSGSKVTEADFIAATKLTPVDVTFSDGSHGAYHKVARLDAPVALVQENIGAFIAKCTWARTVKLSNGAPVPNLTKAQAFEHGFSPEAIGTFEIPPRDACTGNRHHGETHRALAAELSRRGTPHSNDRIGQYGPDLFTYGNGPKVLFEIKSDTSAKDVFAAVGQLYIYDRLLGGGYRKVIVVPNGMGAALEGPVAALGIATVEFRREGRKIVFDLAALSQCLA